MPSTRTDLADDSRTAGSADAWERIIFQLLKAALAAQFGLENNVRTTVLHHADARSVAPPRKRAPRLQSAFRILRCEHRNDPPLACKVHGIEAQHLAHRLHWRPYG